ncbi:unnamed protein product [Dovyalis caffra]|uniref:Uncharacterized protein n=1 Tax=Dovyalis caffra TaxID=77055 RepID=A0AAV1R6F9_9ROSI|nr:unnamed protein product [Dovyalis caffra]
MQFLVCESIIWELGCLKFLLGWLAKVLPIDATRGDISDMRSKEPRMLLGMALGESKLLPRIKSEKPKRLLVIEWDVIRGVQIAIRNGIGWKQESKTLPGTKPRHNDSKVLLSMIILGVKWEDNFCFSEEDGREFLEI